MHREQQIFDAFVAEHLARAATFGDRVYEQRDIPLSEREQELPAAAIFKGEDRPISDLGNDNVAFIDSLIELKVVLAAQADTEKLLTVELSRLRAESHIGVMADQTHGLAFVIGTRYGGAGEPEITFDGSRATGSIETRWAVHYRMNITDPN